jgi:hypothetical protein
MAFSMSNVARADDDRRSFPTTITEPDGFTCPIPNFFATPAQVIATRIAALQVGDINGVMCTYGIGASVIMAGSVVTGRPAIQAAFISFFGLLGNTLPTFTSQTYAGPVGLITYTIQSSSVTVPDGADSFVIEFGRIRYHTVSATLQFH